MNNKKKEFAIAITNWMRSPSETTKEELEQYIDIMDTQLVRVTEE